MSDRHQTSRDIRAEWKERFQLTRPTASPEAIERAIDSVVADPFGAYAVEIREYAARLEHEASQRQPAETQQELINRSIAFDPVARACYEYGKQISRREVESERAQQDCIDAVTGGGGN